MLKNFKKHIFRIKSSKEASTLVSNFSYLLFLQIAGYVFPLITIPYLARVIGVESFGKIAFASAVILWFQTISDWGFNYTATRDVAKNRADTTIVSHIFSNVLWARLLLALCSFLALVTAIMLIPTFRENQAILLISFLLIPGHIMFPDWFFQAMEKMKYITIFNLISKLLFTIAIFVFIKEKDDFILQPLFISLGYIVSGIFAMYIIIFKWKVKVSRPIFKDVLKTIKSSTDVFINNIMPNLYNSFSTVLLGFYGGSISNGKFDAGNKFIVVAKQFLDVLSRIFFPFLSRRISKHKIYVRLNITIAVVFTILLLLFAPLIIKYFFTEEFYDSIVVLRIMSLSIIFLSLSNIYGTNYMIVQGFEKELRNITFLGSVFGFIISFPLIINFGFIGAAITVTLTRGILGFSIMLQSKKIANKITKNAT